MNFVGFVEIITGFEALFWIALAIFQLVVTLSARKRYPGRATFLMLIGSFGRIANVVLQPALPFLMGGYDLSHTEITIYYNILSVVGGAFNLLFLIGVFELVKGKFLQENPTSRHLL